MTHTPEAAKQAQLRLGGAMTQLVDGWGTPINEPNDAVENLRRKVREAAAMTRMDRRHVVPAPAAPPEPPVGGEVREDSDEWVCRCGKPRREHRLGYSASRCPWLGAAPQSAESEGVEP